MSDAMAIYHKAKLLWTPCPKMLQEENKLNF